MAYSLVTSAKSTTGSTTDAVDTTGATLIIVCTGAYGAYAGCSDNKSNSWTQLTGQHGLNAYGRLYYCVNPTVGSGHTFSNSGSYSKTTMVAFSGNAASPFDAENGAGGSSALATGNVTPAENNSLVITGIAIGDGVNNASVDGAFTLAQIIQGVVGTYEGSGLAYEIQTTATTRQATWSWTGSDTCGAMIAAFKAAAAGGGTVQIGQATETDLAQALAAVKVSAIGQAAETDAAQALTAGKAGEIGQAAETDLAQALTADRAQQIGQAAETDLAQAINVGGNIIVAVGQVAEADLAQAIAWAPKHRAVSQAAETDLAQAINVGGTITIAVNQAVETDLPQTITWAPKHRLIGQATEIGTAQSVSVVKVAGIALALEIELAQPIAWAPKIRQLGLVSESDFAQTITAVGAAVLLPPGKVYGVGPRTGFRVDQ